MTEQKNILELLNDWRLLPRYELERRVDALIALHLHEIIRDNLFSGYINRDDLIINIIPEFPILNNPAEKYNTKKKNKEDDSNINTASHVDFLLFCDIKQEQKVYLVEIKTDTKSYRDKQLNNMLKNRLTVRELIKKAIEIAQGSKEKLKYAYLLKQIEQIISKNIKYLDITAEILYICPEKLAKKENIIRNNIKTITLFEIGNNKSKTENVSYFCKMLSSWDKSPNEVLTDKSNRRTAKQALKQQFELINDLL